MGQTKIGGRCSHFLQPDCLLQAALLVNLRCHILRAGRGRGVMGGLGGLWKDIVARSCRDPTLSYIDLDHADSKAFSIARSECTGGGMMSSWLQSPVTGPTLRIPVRCSGGVCHPDTNFASS